ncbi:DUF2867 domain-containing protein [Streptomyces cinnabarinus]|uniref:DUF2867 domain-containing protein n=1 Tax=Streptomyces cinnabarinus TaxID=67287 RepID=A0ABY7KE03_9ACTN|nr:DUF2867 domain-containing protein [Streptomyces cinnabarinus]WAZ21169.1 DUF2867 domain-containing protein [Streptomyces cinnabarinus]
MGTVRNVHDRVLAAPADRVGALLDRLAAPDDPLFPSPAWAPVRFDRPLSVGAAGGHGPVRYSVAEYEPGRRVRFAFDPPGTGFHELSVEPLGPDRCRIRHLLEQDQPLGERLGWLLAVRAVHGTVIEELFDNAELAATGSLPAPVRPGRYVRLLQRLTWDRPRAVAVPEGAALLHAAFPESDYTDAYALELRPGMPTDPAVWAGVLRGTPVVAGSARELLMGEDAGHLDFRASLLVDEEGHTVTLGSVVRIHNGRGRLYWSVVRHAHPFMARLMLRRTHRRLALRSGRASQLVS